MKKNLDRNRLVVKRETIANLDLVQLKENGITAHLIAMATAGPREGCGPSRKGCTNKCVIGDF